MTEPIQRLARLLARLPGIGEKSGARLAYYIWLRDESYARDLAGAIVDVKELVHACKFCGRPDEQNPCSICSDPDRDRSRIMVMEGPQDLETLERAGVYKGLYHVLGGTLSPLAGKGPDSLNLESLYRRLREGAARPAGGPEDGTETARPAEVILATNPSAEGDATAAFLERELAGMFPDLEVTRLARGIPTGSEIKYLDPGSIGHAIQGRARR